MRGLREVARDQGSSHLLELVGQLLNILHPLEILPRCQHRQRPWFGSKIGQRRRGDGILAVNEAARHLAVHVPVRVVHAVSAQRALPQHELIFGQQLPALGAPVLERVMRLFVR